MAAAVTRRRRRRRRSSRAVREADRSPALAAPMA
jgi:hypothetical protein